MLLYFFSFVLKVIKFKNEKMKLLSLALLFAISIVICNAQETKPGPQPPPETGEKFKVGMAGYTFVKFDLDKTLETLKKTGVHY